MPPFWFVLLLAGSAAAVGVVVYLLLRASAEEEARALEAWERAVGEPRRVQRGTVWDDDDAA